MVVFASAVAVCCGRGCACAGAVAAVAVCVLSECITIIRLSMRAESCAALTSHFCASVVVVPCAAVSVHAVRYKPAAAIRAAINKVDLFIEDGRGFAPLTWAITPVLLIVVLCMCWRFRVPRGRWVVVVVARVVAVLLARALPLTCSALPCAVSFNVPVFCTRYLSEAARVVPPFFEVLTSARVCCLLGVGFSGCARLSGCPCVCRLRVPLWLPLPSVCFPSVLSLRPPVRVGNK